MSWGQLRQKQREMHTTRSKAAYGFVNRGCGFINDVILIGSWCISFYVEDCVAYDVEYDEPIVFNDERFIIGDSVNDFADTIAGRPNVLPALRNTLEVEVRFFSNVRKTFPRLATVNNVGYRPRFVVAGIEERLGVQFLKSDLREFDQPGKAIVSLCFFESIDYSSLKPSVAFSIMEGPRAVGEGRVVGEIQRFEGNRYLHKIL